MGAVTEYRNTLAQVVKNQTLHADNWKNPEWKVVSEKVTQEVLDDAFAHGKVLAEVLSTAGGELRLRNCKTIERVGDKQKQIVSEPIKHVNDFVAARIICPVKDIPQAVDAIRKMVLEEKGQIYVRGENENKPYGFCKDGDQFKDITQYVYIFLERIGHIAEVQIGEEFAAHTFTIDSARRTQPKLVSLWNKDFYDTFKQHLLDKANGKATGAKETIINLANEIHDGKVPSELESIMERSL